MNAIIEQWNRITHRLQRQIAGHTPDAIIEETRDRIRAFAEGADAMFEPLPKPDFGDPAFEGLTWGECSRVAPVRLWGSKGALPNETIPELSGLPVISADKFCLPDISDITELFRASMTVNRLLLAAQEQCKEYSRVRHLLDQRYFRACRAEGDRREFISHNFAMGKPRHRPYRPGPCWCGCGKMAGLRLNSRGGACGVNRFLQGHIARYISYMLRVERGHMRREELPDLLIARIKWVRCLLCRGWIPDTDPLGRKLEDGVGLACWRERRGLYWPYTTR